LPYDLILLLKTNEEIGSGIQVIVFIKDSGYQVQALL